MRCSKCKTYNHDKARFCIKCGSSLNVAATDTNNKPLQKHYTYLILLGLVCLCVLVFFLYQLFSDQKKNNMQKVAVLNVEYTLQNSSEKAETADNINSAVELDKPLFSSTARLGIKPGTREEIFKQALSIKDSDPIKSLILFTDGYNLNSSFSSFAEIPENLKDKNIEKVILELILQLHSLKEDNIVMTIFTPEVLEKVDNESVFKQVVKLWAENLGYGRAIQFAVSVKQHFFFLSNERAQMVNRVIINLYCEWLLQELDSNNIDNAVRIYNFAINEFPGNTDLELFGVELALIEGNWIEAERLLNQIEISPTLSNKVKELKRKISEIKGEDGKTIIKFKPGTKHIPLLADLNGKLKQKFLVDTGASFVTVPNSTIKALGVKIGSNATVRKVATAGGVKDAKEIVLGSISIGNCTVNNIKVLVLDIPGQPDLGLLGLNFLQLFHVEMDNENGRLILKPR